MVCQICGRKKGKRNCLALGGLICNECCGKKRRKFIPCPSHCRYLQKSQGYLQEKELTELEVKLRRAFPGFFHNLEGKIIEFRKHRFTDLTDFEVKEALEQNLANLNLQKKVIIYEYKSVNPKVQMLSDIIREVINFLQKPPSGPRQLGEAEDSFYDLDTLIFLLRGEIEFLKRLMEEGKGNTYYLDLINTLY